MQSAKLVSRQSAPLLRKVPCAVGPRRHARICPLLRRQFGERWIGAVVGAVPRKQHSLVAAGLADLLQVIERHARHVVDRVVAGDPLQAVRPRRVGRERLEDVPGPLVMHFVIAGEAERLAVHPGHVFGRQDLDRAAAVLEAELFRQRRIELGAQFGVHLDKLAHEVKIVGRLVLVVRQDERHVPLQGAPDHGAVERPATKIGGFVVLLRPSRYHHVVLGRAVRSASVERLAKDFAAVRLHGVE